MYEPLPFPITITDIHNNVLICNKEVRLVGYDKIIGESARQTVPDDLLEEARWLRREVMEKGYIYSYETERLRGNGTRFPVELIIVPFKDRDGNTVGFMDMGKDITERKRLEQELIRAERLAAIGQLASSVAHELRQPLAVLSNAAYFLRMRLRDGDKKVQRHLSIMEREVAIAEGIISNILDFACPKKHVLEEVAIDAIIERALSRAQIPSGVKVTTGLEPGQRLWADPEQIERVFLNLILNSIQAMPNGGRLGISTQREGKYLKVELADSGVGIAEEDLEHVFEPMFTLKAKGVGLGLAIVKSIVEAHHGSIELKSKVGYGTPRWS
jgi:PAS domain S-box-containing protein